MLTKENFKKYEDLVDRNFHGEVLVEVAKDYHATYYATIFQSINTIHELEGGIRPDVLALRTRFTMEFREYLAQTLDQEEYEKISRFV